MFYKIKEFFLGKSKNLKPVTEAPYKLEAPVPAATPEPFAVEGAGAVNIPEKPKQAPAAKAPRKPRAKKTPAK
jgi:hypothetical protein